MKTTEPDLELLLTDHLQADLPGLTAKHTRQMHKKVAASARKLAKSYARLLTKERKARDKQHLRATKSSVQGLVRKLHEALAERVIAPAAHRARRAAAA